jgi:hypothetical protein
MTIDGKPIITMKDINSRSGDLNPPSQNNLVYEETPIIEPIADPVIPKDLPNPLATPELLPEKPRKEISPVALSRPVKSGGGCLGMIRNIVFFLLLIGIGILISMAYQYISTLNLFKPAANTNTNINQPTPTTEPDNGQNMPLITPSANQLKPMIKPSVVQTAGQSRRYQIQKMDKTGSGFSVILSGVVVDPVCDGSGCESYGTYLPGGTRLTLAVKSYNKTADDFGRTNIIDAAGVKFDTSTATISGKLTREFKGTFNGLTTGGYRFNQMHGYMILAQPNMTLEINHFTPSGINADFTSDESVFEEIVKSLQ